MRFLVLLIFGATACHQPQNEIGVPRSRHRTYKTFPADQWTTAETEDNMDPTVPPVDTLHGAGAANMVKGRFAGKDRSGPKTSIAEAPLENFSSVVALQASLPVDQKMLDHAPEITKQTMERADEENRNVHVTAWIYAIKYESDNDWHLITGTDPSGGSRHYFNAEVSGLPKGQAGHEAPSYKALLETRQALAEILDNDLPGPGSYRTYDPPIPVMVEGSMFYDVDHAPGVVGPGNMKPTTAWEIHRSLA